MDCPRPKEPGQEWLPAATCLSRLGDMALEMEGGGAEGRGNHGTGAVHTCTSSRANSKSRHVTPGLTESYAPSILCLYCNAAAMTGTTQSP